MTKNYCDRCGKELQKHEGHFLKFVKTCSVYWDKWNIWNHRILICFDKTELCEECYESFLNLYDDFIKKKEKKVKATDAVTVTYKE